MSCHSQNSELRPQFLLHKQQNESQSRSGRLEEQTHSSSLQAIEFQILERPSHSLETAPTTQFWDLHVMLRY
jgi:hypothetical protein